MLTNEEAIIDINEIVNYLVNKYETRNPFKIAQKLRIRVSFLNFNNDLLAFSDKVNTSDNGSIFINKNVSYYGQKILCAHELGHIIMHGEGTNLFDTGLEPEKEFEANYFTMCLLPSVNDNVPDDAWDSCDRFNEYVEGRIRYLIYSAEDIRTDILI